MVDEPPTGVAGDMVPVVLPTLDAGMVPSGADGIVAVDGVIVAVVPPGMDVESMPDTVDRTGTGAGVLEATSGGGTAGGGTGMVEPGKTVRADVAGCWDHVNGAIAIGGSADVVGAADGVAPMAVPVADAEGVVEVTVTVGVPGVICPVGVEQLTTVPGVVGSEASGTGASVVPAVPGWVVAENGLGPKSGEVTIVAGVDERPMAVVPMVETCARQVGAPNNSVATASSKRCIVILPPH
jgi:hypothetical protein